MPSCAICKNQTRTTKGTGISYYRFPKDAGMRERWLSVCKKTPNNFSNARVCSIHFADDAFDITIKRLLGYCSERRPPGLKLDAMPTLHLENTPEVVEYSAKKRPTSPSQPTTEPPSCEGVEESVHDSKISVNVIMKPDVNECLKEIEEQKKKITLLEEEIEQLREENRWMRNQSPHTFQTGKPALFVQVLHFNQPPELTPHFDHSYCSKDTIKQEEPVKKISEADEIHVKGEESVYNSTEGLYAVAPLIQREPTLPDTKEIKPETRHNQHVTSQQNRATNKPETKRKRYTKKDILCPVCGKLFGTNTCLQIHMTTHSQERIHKCDKCPKAFKTIAVLRRHKEGVHAEEKYQCAICGKLLKTLYYLEGHMKLKHFNTPTHTCHLCGASFKRSDYCKRHLKRHTTSATFPYGRGKKKYRLGSVKESEEPLPCKYCNCKFKYINQLRAHLLRRHLNGGTRFKCQHCDMTFSTKHTRMKHEKRHADPEKFELTCKVCFNIFQSKEELEVHASKHKGSKRRKCDLCEETFPSKYLLISHKRYHFSPEAVEKQKVSLLAEGLREYI